MFCSGKVQGLDALASLGAFFLALLVSRWDLCYLRVRFSSYLSQASVFW